MSRISHKHKFIFFAFPKTGSDCVRKILAPYSDVICTVFTKTTDKNPFYSHITPTETRDIFESKGWKFDEYFKFVFVRNPFARVVSLYNMIAKDQDFKEWLKTLKNKGDGGCLNPNHKWKIYGAYSLINFISDKSGCVLVDKIIKLEDIDKVLPKMLFKKFGIRIKKIPKTNQGKYKSQKKTSDRKYRKYYDDESRKIVENLYSYELDTFNYEF